MRNCKQTTYPLPNEGFRRFFKNPFHLMRHLKGDPHHIALGIAIGVFVSVTPTVPFHTIIAVALAIALKGSKPAAAIGVWFCNPFTIPFIYIASYYIGAWFLGKKLTHPLNTESLSHILKMGIDVTLSALLGGILLGAVLAVISYFLTKYLCARVSRRTV